MLATDKKVYSLRSCSHIRTGNGNDFEPRNGRKWRDKVWDTEEANMNSSKKEESALQFLTLKNASSFHIMNQ